MSATPQPKKSFRDLDPVEQGGRTARAGFEYQDHVAAGKCLDMLLGGELREVWCEAEDDIVLVLVIDGVEWFEFVQVKGTDLGQAWTVAKLCEHEPAKNGKAQGRCIVDKSLTHDRGAEKCRFRLVTQWQPEECLAVLKLALGKPRDGSKAEVATAASNLSKKLASCVSPNGNGIGFWAEVTVWEVQAGIDEVRNSNLLKLERVLDAGGRFLAPDQRRELYDRLFRRVQDASLKDGRTEKDHKRLRRDDLRAWLLAQAHAILHPTPAGGSTNLENKLTAISTDSATVEAAKEQLRHYLHEVRQPRYLALADREALEVAVLACLHRLKTRLDAEELTDNGRQFHSRCQQELLALRDSLAMNPKPTEGLLYGCMYNVMNRCLHRLVRASA